MIQYEDGDKTIKPILPEEVTENKINSIDPLMIETVNELITKHWTVFSAVIKENEIVEVYCKKT